MQSHLDNDMNDFFKKKERLRRIEEIEKESKSMSSMSWYALTWNFFAGMAEGIQEGFRIIARDNPIFALIYPDHPGTQSLLPAIAYSTWSIALKVLSPLTLIFSWMNTVLAFKRLWQKSERSFWDYTDAALSLAGSIAWTVLFAVGAAGAVAAITSVLISAPYLIPAVFGVYALYGFAKCMKNCFHAFQAWRVGNSAECKAYLKNATKELVSVVINTFALVTSIFLGVKMQEAIEKLKNLQTFEAGKEAVNYCFDKATAALYALGTAIGVGALRNTSKMNQETVEVLGHPIDSMKRAWYAMKSDPVSAFKTLLSVPIKLPLRIAALVITGPIHAIAKLGSMAVSWWKNRSMTEDSNKSGVGDSLKSSADKTVPIKRSQWVNEQAAEVKRGHLEESKLSEDKYQNQQKLQPRLIHPKEMIHPSLTDARIKDKIKKMDASFPSMKHAPEEVKAKRFHLEELSKFINGQSKYRSVEQIERYSQLISCHGLYRNNFRMKGSEVKELTDEVRLLAAPAA